MTSPAAVSPIASNKPAGLGPRRPVLVLASSSPRRLELLRQIGIEPEQVEAPDVDETPARRELPLAYARRMALAKVMAVAGRVAGDAAFVLAADTVVACGRRILPKATTTREAHDCLALLSGRRHRVYGGVAVAGLGLRPVVRVVLTVVQMKRLSPAELAQYLAAEEWAGKAGGYAIQGRAAAFIKAINGSYSNVVGLPLLETVQLLEGAGWRRGEPGS